MSKSRTPLLDALIKYQKKNFVPLHMPGHKMGKGVSRKFYRTVEKNLFGLDLTEVPGMDDLNNPIGVIKEAQSRASEIFGADYSFFLVNGTTVGIHAAILGVCKPGDEILMPRDVHRSVMGACILSGVRPNYLEVRFDEDFYIPYPVSPEDVAKKNQNIPVKALIQVYPSYFGLAGDIQGIVQIAHNKNVPVIVDEAHGAHFRFSDKLPVSALEAGADICIQSTHKTLGSFTQSSMLHIKSRLVNKDEVVSQLRILQSTSPSYLLMASLDAAVDQMDGTGIRLLENIIYITDRTRKIINDIPGFKCLGPEKQGNNGIVAIDPTKLCISVTNLGLTGYQVGEILTKKYRIQVELCDIYNILCMFSIGNTPQDAAKLIKALKEISARGLRKADKPLLPSTLPSPQVIMTPREAWFSRKRTVPIREAVGYISAELVAPYPPGIPVLCPGEEITHEIVDIIEEYKVHNHSFHGCADSDINTILVVEN